MDPEGPLRGPQAHTPQCEARRLPDEPPGRSHGDYRGTKRTDCQMNIATRQLQRPSLEARLWAARALAWALLFGGWFVLGALGHARTPIGAGVGLAAVWPIALWLLGVGALLGLTQGHGSSRARLAWGIGLATSIAAWALSAGPGSAPLAALALAWAALLVGASRAVRLLRQSQSELPPAPVAPAIVGAALAWLLAGDLSGVAQHPGLTSAALGLAATLLAVLVPARAHDAKGCRTGLFDCSLPFASLTKWGPVADWPLRAAAFVMLPMMTTLPTLTERCAAAGTSVAAMTALHLTAMLLPAWAAMPFARSMSARQLRAAVTALLITGAVLPWLWAGWNGLMTASLLHCTAWSLAWAVPMLQRDAPRAAARGSALGAGACSAIALMALGLAIEQLGLAALQVCLVGLALVAFAGVAATPLARSAAGRQAR